MFLTDIEIGARVAELRRELGITAQALAERAGLSKDELHDLEEQGAPLPTQAMTAIAEVLGVSADSLLRAEETSTAPLFRASSVEACSEDAISSADRIIDDFFALEALTRR